MSERNTKPVVVVGVVVPVEYGGARVADDIVERTAVLLTGPYSLSGLHRVLQNFFRGRKKYGCVNWETLQLAEKF